MSLWSVERTSADNTLMSLWSLKMTSADNTLMSLWSVERTSADTTLDLEAARGKPRLNIKITTINPIKFK